MDTISSVFLTIVILSAVNGKVLKQEYLYLRDNEVIKPLKHVPKDEKVVPKQRQIIYTVEPQEGSYFGSNIQALLVKFSL